MTTSAPVVDMTGKKAGTQPLNDVVFAVQVNEFAMHQALLRQLANARQGTHATKNRGDVSGGGAKPWRQKGTGRARQGSSRAPHWKGGGVVFGPHPHGYKQDMPKRQRRLALRSALSAKVASNQITVLDKIDLAEPKTKKVVELCKAIEAGRRVLLVLGSHHDALEHSARNLPEVNVILASNASVRDLLMADTVICTRDAIEHFEEALAS